jgi:anti-sigma B factor antagonist
MMPDPVPSPSSFFNLSREGDIYIIAVDRDRLTDEDNLEQFSQDINQLIEKHEIRSLILQLTNVRYMTSSAIGKLIGLHRKINRADGRMVLCELTPDVSATLETSRLLGYFAVEPDLAAAIYTMHAW